MRRLLLCFLVSLSVACGRSQIVRKPPAKITVSTVKNSERHRADVVLAILPLRNNTSDRALDETARALDDFLTSHVSDFGGVSLVERQRVSDIMRELHLGESGAVDQASAVRVGGLLGANVMAFGSLSRLSGRQVVSMRVVKVETGEIVGGINEFVADASRLQEAAERISRALFSAIPSLSEK